MFYRDRATCAEYPSGVSVWLIFEVDLNVSPHKIISNADQFDNNLNELSASLNLLIIYY